MKVVVKGTNEIVCEVVTNHSMTLQQALDLCDFNEETWCKEHGWDIDGFSPDLEFEMNWDN